MHPFAPSGACSKCHVDAMVLQWMCLRGQTLCGCGCLGGGEPNVGRALNAAVCGPVHLVPCPARHEYLCECMYSTRFGLRMRRDCAKTLSTWPWNSGVAVDGSRWWFGTTDGQAAIRARSVVETYTKNTVALPVVPFGAQRAKRRRWHFLSHRGPRPCRTRTGSGLWDSRDSCRYIQMSVCTGAKTPGNRSHGPKRRIRDANRTTAAAGRNDGRPPLATAMKLSLHMHFNGWEPWGVSRCGGRLGPGAVQQKKPQEWIHDPPKWIRSTPSGYDPFQWIVSIPTWIRSIKSRSS